MHIAHLVGCECVRLDYRYTLLVTMFSISHYFCLGSLCHRKCD